MSASPLPGWRLEVVKGRSPGATYPLGPGPIVLGADPGPGGIDLRSQVPSERRDLAARHAELVLEGAGFAIRDLDSPAGVFVNRVRALSGGLIALKSGDVIALGAVALKIALAPPTVTVTAPHSPKPVKETKAFAYSVGSVVCKCWDDFLTCSAQSWPGLREELASGRLDRFVRSIGRADLAPAGAELGGLDDRLDQWLGKLPTTKPAVAELDVAPAELRLPADRGGVIRRSLRISNVGYRLLRSSVRVIGDARSWITIDDLYARPFTTLEATNVPVEIRPPENLAGGLSGWIEIESNGGTKRVSVSLEKRKPERIEPIVSGPATLAPDWVDHLSGLSPVQRIAIAAGVLVSARLLFFLTSRWGAGLTGPAGAMALMGAGLGIAYAIAKRRPMEAVSSGIAAAVLGLMAACIGSAGFAAVESILGGWASALPIAVVLWAGVAAIVAFASTAAIPPTKSNPRIT